MLRYKYHTLTLKWPTPWHLKTPLIICISLSSYTSKPELLALYKGYPLVNGITGALSGECTVDRYTPLSFGQWCGTQFWAMTSSFIGSAGVGVSKASFINFFRYGKFWFSKSMIEVFWIAFIYVSSAAVTPVKCGRSSIMVTRGFGNSKKWGK